MKQTRTILTTLKTILSAAFAAAWTHSENRLVEILEPTSIPVFLVCFVAAFVCFGLLEIGTHWAINHSRLLRALLAGDDVEGTFIEGTFLEGALVLVTSVRIAYTDGGLRVCGESFEPDGQPEANFRSHMADYDNLRLRYAYTENGDGEVEGYAVYQFTGDHGRPKGYRGYFLDNSGRTRRSVLGRRLSKAEAQALETDGKSALIAWNARKFERLHRDLDDPVGNGSPILTPRTSE